MLVPFLWLLRSRSFAKVIKVRGLQKSFEDEHLWSYCVDVLGISGKACT